MPQPIEDPNINGTAPPKTELEQLQFQANQVTDEVLTNSNYFVTYRLSLFTIFLGVLIILSILLSFT